MRRKKVVPGTIVTAPYALENVPESDGQRAQTLANLLRPTLEHPLDHATLKKLAKAARLSPRQRAALPQAADGIQASHCAAQTRPGLAHAQESPCR